MKEINVYSTVVGELPKLVNSKQPKTFIPYEDFLNFKKEVQVVLDRTTHTSYQNKCYIDFLFRKIGFASEDEK